MKLTKENIARYLLTLQLIGAGYSITWDELIEMYAIKTYLDPKKRYFWEFTQTTEQSKIWFINAVYLAKKALKIETSEAMSLVANLDFSYGLMIKDYERN